MIGHTPLIAMRKAGLRPQSVFLTDYPNPCARDWHDPGMAIGEDWQPDATHIEIQTADNPKSLDLRFLVGLDAVHVASPSESRAIALFEAAKRAGAKCVVAMQVMPGHRAIDQTGWFGHWTAEASNG